MNMQIWYWSVNLLIMSLPMTWYIIFQQYKDIKKKDKLIELQNSIIKNSKLYAEV